MLIKALISSFCNWKINHCSKRMYKKENKSNSFPFHFPTEFLLLTYFLLDKQTRFHVLQWYLIHILTNIALDGSNDILLCLTYVFFSIIDGTVCIKVAWLAYMWQLFENIENNNFLRKKTFKISPDKRWLLLQSSNQSVVHIWWLSWEATL